MNESRRTSQARRSVRGAFAAVLLGAFVLSGASPAQAAAPARREPGVSTYSVGVSPSGAVTLCPDQTQVFSVSLRRQVARAVGGGQSTGRPRPLPRARIFASVSNPAVGTISPASTQTARWHRPRGSSSSSTIRFTFTANQLGDTTITFRGEGLLNPPQTVPGGPGEEDLTGFPTNPTAQVPVHVKCAFLLNMDSYWLVPGERTHEGKGTIRNVGIAPDEVGAFSVHAQMHNTVSVSSSQCTGSATVSASDVTVEGTLDPDSKLYVKVTYGPVKHTSTESCRGKSQTGAGTPQPIEFQFIVDQRRLYDLSLSPHIMDDDAGALPGTTLVDLYRLGP